MPAKKEYTAEFKEQSVRFVFEHIEPDESRYAACARLGPKLNVKSVTLYNWEKIAMPKPLKSAAGSSSSPRLSFLSLSLLSESSDSTSGIGPSSGMSGGATFRS